MELSDANDVQLDQFLLETFQSKDEFLVQFEKKFDKKQLDVITLLIIKELETSVLENNLSRYSKFNILLSYAVEQVNTVSENCKLIVLACKHVRLNILEFILENLNKTNSDLPILPDQQVSGHDCIYYAIRSGNTNLIVSLITKWPHNYFDKFPEKLEYLLSSSYDKLQINNVPLSTEMEIYIGSKLLDLRFLAEDLPLLNKTDFYDTIENRTKFLLENIKTLTSSSNVDSEFLFVSRFVVHSIHILKRQLKSTYSTLPWEEIEFCLLAFISVHTKCQECDLFFQLKINFDNIKMHLKTFAMCLESEANTFLKKISPKLGILPRISRKTAIKNITQRFPGLTPLYKDYHDIRDFHSLEKIQECIMSANSVNENDNLSRFVIVRKVQILGEYFKNSLESPKLSESTGELLLQNLPENTRNIIKELRNALSHSHALQKRTELEENGNTSFYSRIQQDLLKVDFVIAKILMSKKIEAIRLLVTEVSNSNNLETIKSLTKASLDNLKAFFEKYPFTNEIYELERLEHAINILSSNITDKSDTEQAILDMLQAFFDSQKLGSKDVNILFVLQSLRMLSDQAKQFYNVDIEEEILHSIKFEAKGFLRVLPEKMLLQNFEKICQLCVDFVGMVMSKKLPNSNSNNVINKAVAEILHVVHPQNTNIQGLNELCNILSTDELHGESSNHDLKYNIQKLQTKLLALSDLLEKHNLKNFGDNELEIFMQDNKLRASLELIVLDILCILGEYKNDSLENNWFFLDEFSPSLLGKALRNNLAHDNNALLDMLLIKPSLSVILNAIKLVQINLNGSIRIGKHNAEYSYSIFAEKFIQGTEEIKLQQKMFDALEMGDLLELKDILDRGGDLLGRNLDLQTSLHVAAKSRNVDMVTFIYNQKLNMPLEDIRKQTPLHIACQFGGRDIVQFLIHTMGLSVSDKDESKDTPLHLAAKHGHVDVVQILLKLNKVDVNDVNNSYGTPLHYATLCGHIDIFKLLIEKTSNKSYIAGFTCLHTAAEYGHTDLVNYLLDYKIDVNKRTDTLSPPLHLAALRGHLKTVKTLLKRGATVNATEHSGMTALHFATERGHTEIVKILLSHGANVTVYDVVNRNTSLHYASRDGFNEICDMLINHGASVNDITIDHFTPLHFSARSQRTQTAILLLKYGANTAAYTKRGYTPLHFAAENGNKDLVEILLEKSNSELSFQNSIGFTPLHLASVLGRVDIIEIMLKYDKTGLCMTMQNIEGSTPLHVAARFGHSNVLDLFHKHNASMDKKDVKERTPLHCAAIEGHSETVKSLIKLGADINNKCANNFTPLTLSVLRGNKEVVRILLKNKANCSPNDLICSVQAGRREIVEILIKSGVNVNGCLKDPCTPLFFAVKNNFKSVAVTLLKNGATVSEECLGMAVNNGYNEMLTLLLQNGASIRNCKPKNISLLHLAVRKNYKDVIISLLKEDIDVDCIDENCATSLHDAAQSGNKDTVDILIENGADVNAADIDGFLPLHFVAAGNGNLEIAEILINNGSQFLTKDKLGRTPAELAAAHDNLDILKLLLIKSEKSDINIKNPDFTLLHIAVMNGRFKIVEHLLQEGANINIPNHLGTKAIHLACRDGHKSIVKLLIKNGASVDDVGAFEQTPLHYAASTGQVDIYHFLTNAGADINKKESSGRTPLHIAVYQKNVAFVKAILNDGAVYNIVDNQKLSPKDFAHSIKDEDMVAWFAATNDLFKFVKAHNLAGVTSCIKSGAFLNTKNLNEKVCPMHYASWKGFTDIVKILLKHKANPNLTCMKGFTPLHYAAKFGHFNLVYTLVSNGAIYNIVSHNGKTPRDLSTDKKIFNLFQMLDNAFSCVKTRDIRIIKDLINVQETSYLNFLMFQAFNDKKQNLLMTAASSGFQYVEMLKDLINRDIKKLITEAELMLAEGQYSEAIKIRQDVISQAVIIFGSDSKEVLESQSALALILHRQGKCEESLKLFEKVLNQQVRLLGSKHPDCLATRLCKALVLHELNRYEQALTINKEIVEESAKFGENPLFISAQNNMAMNLEKLGQYETALKTFKEVWERKKSFYGNNHRETLRTESCIAVLILQEKKNRESLICLEKVLNMQKNHLGVNDPDTVFTQVNLANFHLTQGNLLKASSNFRKNFEQRKVILGVDHTCIKDIESKLKHIERTQILVGDSLYANIDNASHNLRRAANDGDLEAVKCILGNTNNVNAADKGGRIPLHFAVNNGHVKVVEFLIQSGADVPHATNKGNTSLHTAASKGNKEIVNILLSHADRDKLNTFVNFRTYNTGTTALHVAAKNGFQDLVKIMLSNGAAYNIQNNEGETPLDLVPVQFIQIKNLFQLTEKVFHGVKNGDSKIISFLRSFKPEEFAAVIMCCDREGNTLVKVAVSKKHLEMAGTLVQLIRQFQMNI